jgi:isopenicillin N synthase-like dioxygenase
MTALTTTAAAADSAGKEVLTSPATSTTTTSTTTISLPIVSLAQWTDPSSSEQDRTILATRVREICHTGPGFFLLQNHGISAKFLERMFAMMRRLFALSLEDKQRIDKKKSRHFRGWEWEGSEYTNNRPDIREQVDLWTEHTPRPVDVEPKYLRLLGPNQWFPNEEILPGYREITMEWFQRAQQVSDTIMEILAVALGLDASYFTTNVFQGPECMSLTKLIRYPPTPENQAGVNAHHDTGFITLLCCETSPGLQVQDEHGAWFNVIPPTPDTLVINLGEMLQAMTGNYFVATPHRVINCLPTERFALGYFHGPSLDTRLDIPLPLSEEYVQAVQRSQRHARAGFMARKEETEAGVGDMQSSYRPTEYGEQLWNYFSRSYPEIMAKYYSNSNDSKA